MKDKLIRALKKKALGLTITESVEEYSLIEGNLEIVKKKITKKQQPPDLNAVKLLLSLEDDYESMGEEQLEKEKKRLLKLLEEKNNDFNKGDSQN